MTDNFDPIAEMQKMFKPTKAKLIHPTREMNMKLGDFVTNTHWVIHEKFRPKILEDYRFLEDTDTQKQQARVAHLKSVINEVSAFKKQLKVGNELSLKAQPGKSLVVKLEGEGFNTWCNVFYVNMFLGMDAVFFQDKAFEPIRVDINGELAGLLYPFTRLD